jgi:hypothetical protein
VRLWSGDRTDRVQRAAAVLGIALHTREATCRRPTRPRPQWSWTATTHDGRRRPQRRSGVRGGLLLRAHRRWTAPCCPRARTSATAVRRPAP